MYGRMHFSCTTLPSIRLNRTVQCNRTHCIDSTKQDFTKCLPEPQLVTKITPELLYTMSPKTPLHFPSRKGSCGNIAAGGSPEDTFFNYPGPGVVSAEGLCPSRGSCHSAKLSGRDFGLGAGGCLCPSGTEQRSSPSDERQLHAAPVVAFLM